RTTPSLFPYTTLFRSALSAFMVRETRAHVALESTLHRVSTDAVSARDVFWRTTLKDRNLSSISQAGLVNNLNDGMAWGLFPLFLDRKSTRLNSSHVSI